MAEISNETLHAILVRVEGKVDKTNGRLRGVEKKVWAVGGGLVVIAVVVVPLFIDMIKN